jgi:hypothetical protein
VMDYADAIIKSARSRIRSRQWELERQQRRFNDYQRAIDRLDEQERLASFPDNPTRVADIERIREERQEVLNEMDREFGLSEQYKEAVGN